MNMNNIDYILIIILLIIMIVIIRYFFIKLKQRKEIEGFNTNNKYLSVSFADVSEPYQYPFMLKDLITTSYCRLIIDKCRDRLVDSEVVGGKHKNIRNSKQCWIPKDDPIVKPIFNAVSNYFNIPFENAEDLQVVRYLPDQYYNEHHDACCDGSDKCLTFIKRGGQRILTVLIYLNNEFESGHTYFKNLDLRIKPSTGSAIVFFPLAQGTNKCHPYALHAGTPVTKGQKWIANIWFRERKFTS